MYNAPSSASAPLSAGNETPNTDEIFFQQQQSTKPQANPAVESHANQQHETASEQNLLTSLSEGTNR